MNTTRCSVRRRLQVVAVMGALAGLLVACGGAGSSNGPAAGGNGAAAEPDEAADPDAEVVIRFSSIFGPSSGLQQQLDWFMDEVEDRTDGRVQFERFYGAALLGAADTLAGIQEGRAEAGYMVPAYAPSNLPLWNGTFVPTEGANPEAIARTQADMATSNAAFEAELEAAGIRMLVFNMIPDLGTIATPEPITEVASLDGLDIRALGYLANALQLKGVNPVVLEAQETYESIQRGVTDGAGAFAIDVLVSEGLHEVAPWVVKLDIGGWVGAGLAINASFYDGLPDDVRAVMEEVADEFYDHALEILAEVEADACDTFLAGDGGVTLLPDQESGTWREEIGESLWEQWRSDAASSGADEGDVASFEEDWRSLTASYAADSAYESGLDLCAARTDLP